MIMKIMYDLVVPSKVNFNCRYQFERLHYERDIVSDHIIQKKKKFLKKQFHDGNACSR